jgi:hypothetical protein
MRLDYFIDYIINYAQDFKTYWLRESSIDPENYPLELKEEDWHEQFLFWVSVQEENNEKNDNLP